MRFRKKPVVIEAVRWKGDNKQEISDFVGDAVRFGMAGEGAQVTDQWLTIRTLEGDMTANIGDYVIKGVKGEFYPCKPDIFEQTYEPAD